MYLIDKDSWETIHKVLLERIICLNQEDSVRFTAKLALTVAAFISKHKIRPNDLPNFSEKELEILSTSLELTRITMEENGLRGTHAIKR